MPYHRIDPGEPEADVIRQLAAQVAELLRADKESEREANFQKALTAVCIHRYGGRFINLRSKVSRHLQPFAVASRMRGKQLLLAI